MCVIQELESFFELEGSFTIEQDVIEKSDNMSISARASWNPPEHLMKFGDVVIFSQAKYK